MLVQKRLLFSYFMIKAQYFIPKRVPDVVTREASFVKRSDVDLEYPGPGLILP